MMKIGSLIAILVGVCGAQVSLPVFNNIQVDISNAQASVVFFDVLSNLDFPPGVPNQQFPLSFTGHLNNVTGAVTNVNPSGLDVILTLSTVTAKIATGIGHLKVSETSNPSFTQDGGTLTTTGTVQLKLVIAEVVALTSNDIDIDAEFINVSGTTTLAEIALQGDSEESVTSIKFVNATGTAKIPASLLIGQITNQLLTLLGGLDGILG